MPASVTFVLLCITFLYLLWTFLKIILKVFAASTENTLNYLQLGSEMLIFVQIRSFCSIKEI